MARSDVIRALSAIDTQTLDAVALETGISARTLWRYRAEGKIPTARLRPLSKALGLS